MVEKAQPMAPPGGDGSNALRPDPLTTGVNND
jgi:hypothetical protein